MQPCPVSPLLAMAVAACLSPDASAASVPSAALDCAKAANAVDKAVCADPVLRDLDGTLAEKWAAASRRTDDRKALLADQRAWLKQRSECIGVDGERACLRYRYAVRTAVLDVVRPGFDWGGKWLRASGGAGFALTPADGSGFTFRLEATSGGHASGIEQARATAEGARVLRVASIEADRPCRLELRRVANQVDLVEIDSAFDCGAAMGVDFAGRYVRDDHNATPFQPTLLTLDLAATAAAEARIRALLGEAGTTDLIDRCQLVQHETGTPGLVTCGVRGLFTYMEAALEQQGDNTVRVAELVDDEVRWWSTDPATRSAPPAWFDAWRANFADRPVRLMSVPGTPLLQDARGD